jgi:hypothetical protein
VADRERQFGQARIQEFLVEGDDMNDMNEEKLGRGLGPP